MARKRARKGSTQPQSPGSDRIDTGVEDSTKSGAFPKYVYYGIKAIQYAGAALVAAEALGLFTKGKSLFKYLTSDFSHARDGAIESVKSAVDSYGEVEPVSNHLLSEDISYVAGAAKNGTVSLLTDIRDFAVEQWHSPHCPAFLCGETDNNDSGGQG